MLSENITIQSCNCSAEGTINLVLGTFGIFENLLTAILIATDSELRNPTYYFMVNLCLADAFALLSVGVYKGLTQFDTGIILFSADHPGIFVWLREVGVLETSVFTIFIAFSRCSTLRSLQVNEQPMNKFYFWMSIIGPWVIFPAGYGALIYFEAVPYSFQGNNSNYDTKKLSGLILQYIFACYSFVCIVSVCVMNVISLFSVRAARKKIQTFIFSSNLKAETKLFLQCAVAATVNFVVTIAYGVIVALQQNLNPILPKIAGVGWIFTHIYSPMVYFALNTRLRRRFVSLCLSICQFLRALCGGQHVKVDVVQQISIVNRGVRL